jgi:hypothetical protein
LGYEGEADTITVAFKKPKDRTLTGLQQQFNKAHNGVRAIGERGNAHLTANCACGMPGHCALFLRNPDARPRICQIWSSEADLSARHSAR